MSNHDPSRIPVYFSHSYRVEDREVNEFFCRLFYKKGFALAVDPKSDTLSVPYLEWLISSNPCFAAVVTHRPEEERYLCSPFILFEYGLAIQAQKPLLVFVEQGVSGGFFLEGAESCTFNRDLLKDSEAEFNRKIDELAEKSRPYWNSSIRLRGKVALVLGKKNGHPSWNLYARMMDRIQGLLSERGYQPVPISPDYEDTFKMILDLETYDFAILDVGPAVLDAWVYPFIHGRFIPTIKLFHLPEEGGVDASSVPLLTSRVLRGVATTEQQIIFWRDPDELLSKFTKQIMKFDTPKPRMMLNTLDAAIRYFRSLGRREAKIFISNADEANDFAEKLSAALIQDNIKHFHYKFNNTINAGEDWRTRLSWTINESQIFVALITKDYQSSEWCQAEYKEAQQRNLKIIPYLLEDHLPWYPTEQGILLLNKPHDECVKIIISRLDKELIDKSEPDGGVELKRTSPGNQSGLRSSLMKGETPANSARPSGRSRKRKPNIDVAVITILPEEYSAVLDHLENIDYPFSSPTQPNTYGWKIGTIQSRHKEPYRVILALTGQAGTNIGAIATSETIQQWKPRYVLLVGIAGGLPRDGLGLDRGDVVVSNFIWGYEYGKIDHDGFTPRHNFTHQVDTALLSAAQVLSVTHQEWRSAITDKTLLGDRLPGFKVGPVGSGDKVIDNLADPYVEAIRAANKQLMAIEMEGVGAAQAVKRAQEKGQVVGFAMIRGISDMPPATQISTDGLAPSSQTTERDTWKVLAAQAAASFAINLIRYEWPLPPRNTRDAT